MRTVGGDQARCLSCVTLEGGKGTLHLALSSLPSQSLGPRGDPGPPVASSGPHRASEPGLSVLAQAAQRKGCLRLWRGCAGPSGVLSCPGSALLHQLKRTFLRRVRAKYPGQLETGSSLHPTRRVGLRGLSPPHGLRAALASPLQGVLWPNSGHFSAGACQLPFLGRERGCVSPEAPVAVDDAFFWGPSP